MAQGASQSIESAYELYNLLKSENKNAHNIYFKNRSERVKSIKKRSDLNFLAFHISNSIIKKIRNTILKRLVKNDSFINSYLGEVYKD
jgi:salicylate hydroxylase